MKHNVQSIHNLMKIHPDGLTTVEIAELTGITYTSVYSVVSRQRDFFIDRWQPNGDSYRWVPVWCLCVTPENAPEPTIKVMDYLRTQERRAA